MTEVEVCVCVCVHTHVCPCEIGKAAISEGKTSTHSLNSHTCTQTVLLRYTDPQPHTETLKGWSDQNITQ